MTDAAEGRTESAAPPPHRDRRSALLNTFRLGGSLLVTWAIAIIVRPWMANHLGVERLGHYQYSEKFAAQVFVLLGLGLDTYITKTIPIRPKHASDFAGTVLLLRTAFGMLLLGFVVFWLRRTGRHPEVIQTAVVFGVAQLFLTLNNSLAALLQATAKVQALAIVNVVSKVLWGGGILVAIGLSRELLFFAVPLLLTEILKTVLILPSVRRELSLVFKVDFGATIAVLRASLPMFVNTVAFTLGATIDVTMLESLMRRVSDEQAAIEVGWYAAGQNIAALAMIMSPLLQSVLMPMMTRAHDRSEEEFFALLRRSIEGVLIVAIPVTMVLSVGADVWIPLLFHHGFGPSVLVLRVLAPAFVMTYLAVLLANSLIILEKSWTVTIVSIGSLAVQPFLMWFLVPWMYALRGPGGAALADAIVMAFLELFSVVGFYVNIGRRALDARAAIAVLKCLVAFAVVALMDRFITFLGPARLVIDCVLYTLIVVVTRAVNVREVITTAKDVIRRRRGG